MGIPITINRTVITTGVAGTITNHPVLAEFIKEALSRHSRGDWGDVDPEDAAANDHAALLNQRVLAVYALPEPITNATTLFGPRDHNRIWIITEADRAVTTVLWPSEY